jgi:hypothetical protein
MIMNVKVIIVALAKAKMCLSAKVCYLDKLVKMIQNVIKAFTVKMMFT